MTVLAFPRRRVYGASVEMARPAGVHSSGKIFVDATGAAVRYLGVSEFRALDRYASGEDVFSWMRDAFPLANMLRVWPYVEWGATGWDVQPIDVTNAFLRDADTMGFSIELTLLTSDDSARTAWASDFMTQLTAAKHPNLLIEIGNEPEYNGIDVNALYPVVEASGYLWSSGRYMEESQRNNLLAGTYGTAHTPRQRDFARRGHDLMEYFNGSGPDCEHTPSRLPWVGDEPIRPDQVESQPVGTVQTNFRSHGGVCALLGAGVTFHHENGKHSTPPTDFERQCADDLFLGATAFAPDETLGPYSRIVEDGAMAESRCYVVGNAMVRCWPPQVAPPQPGWIALDPDGILFRRG